MNHFLNKVVGFEELQSQVEDWKKASLRVVFTNGCFDMFHPGHLSLLDRASQFGERLIVAINANMSVKKLKGENRPIFDEIERVKTVAALQFVDAVILFSDETPLKLIEACLPDVLVKGGDYQHSNIVGADVVLSNGGKIEIVPLREGYSTSQIIERLSKSKSK